MGAYQVTNISLLEIRHQTTDLSYSAVGEVFNDYKRIPLFRAYSHAEGIGNDSKRKKLSMYRENTI